MLGIDRADAVEIKSGGASNESRSAPFVWNKRSQGGDVGKIPFLLCMSVDVESESFGS